MSVARPAARSFLTRCLASAPAPARSKSRPTAPAPSSSPPPAWSPPTCHHFHSSAQLGARRKSRFKSVRAEEMGLVSPEAVDRFAKEKFPEYSPQEKEELRKHYTPEQLAALEAGEQAVDPRDLTIQGRLRIDPYRLPYIEDFSRVLPVVDKRPKTQPPPKMDGARFMTPDEFEQDMTEWLRGFVPEGTNLDAMDEQQLQDFVEEHAPSDLDVTRYFHERSSMTDGNQQQNTALAPGLPDKVPGVAGLYGRAIDPADEGLDDEGEYKDLKKQTGLGVATLLDMRTKVLVTRFVTNQTRLGKVQSMYVLAIAGNKDGWLGLGEAKSVEASVAIAKAKKNAIRNLKPIRRYENRTIFGEVEEKVSGTIVQLRSRPPGFGLRVSHRIFEMCRAAGIHDLSAKIPRSRNPMNTVKAAYLALTHQRDPEEMAIGRGKKLVDVRKVYYGGAAC